MVQMNFGTFPVYVMSMRWPAGGALRGVSVVKITYLPVAQDKAGRVMALPVTDTELLYGSLIIVPFVLQVAALRADCSDAWVGKESVTTVYPDVLSVSA